MDDIAAGDHVHLHNCEFRMFERDYAYSTELNDTPFVPEDQRRTFEGYKRATGKVGTRNHIGILTSVNCSATVARYIADTFNRTDRLGDYGNIDGVSAFVHATGCGMADSGEGYENLQRTLWGYAQHPNFAGVLIVGLGCEVNQIPFLLDGLWARAQRHFSDHDHPGERRHPQDRRRGGRAYRLDAAGGKRCASRDGAGERTHRGAAMRRFGRVFRHHCQPGSRQRGRPAGRQWRHRHPVGDAGDLRRRTSAHPPRGQPRGRREADRADSLVGGLHRA